jgi:hypothetical protein
VFTVVIVGGHAAGLVPVDSDEGDVQVSSRAVWAHGAVDLVVVVLLVETA